MGSAARGALEETSFRFQTRGNTVLSDFIMTGRRRTGYAVITMAITSLLMAGCEQPLATSSYSPVCEPAQRPGSGQRAVTLNSSLRIGHSVDGTPIHATVIGDGPEVVLIMATIHGNEAAGTPLVRRLETYLMHNPHLTEGQRIVLLPVANPDGMSSNTRTNRNGVDLNRNFPAGNFDGKARHGHQPLSQPESHAIHQLIEAWKPTRIVSIHQPLSCIDYDGPARELAEAMAARCDLPVRRLGSRPGSLGSYVGLTRQTPIITMELPRAADELSDDQRWERYGPALLEAIWFPSVEAK